MKYTYCMVTAILLMLSASNVYAEPHCIPTVPVAVSHYPGAASIPTSNNLLQPAGKAVAVEGQRLIITGRLLDSRCIPIREAVVELWQTDPFGHWYLAEGADLVNPNAVFAGAGRTTTDTDGRFTFITAFPGSPTRTIKDAPVPRAPQVNLRVKAQGFSIFSTALFFFNDRRNAADDVYAKLSPDTRKDVTLSMVQGNDDTLTGQIDITLPGKAPYLKY